MSLDNFRWVIEARKFQPDPFLSPIVPQKIIFRVGQGD